MKLTVNGINATLQFSLPDETQVTRQFYTSCGCIYEQLSSRNSQVCSRLRHAGNTLRATQDNLGDVIRKHYRLMRYDMMAAYDGYMRGYSYFEPIDYNPNESLSPCRFRDFF